MNRLFFSFTFLLAVTFVSAAQAQRIPLSNDEVGINCLAYVPTAGAAPVILKADRSREIHTQWGLFKRSFNFDVMLEHTLGGMVTHITLRPRGENALGAYHLYLMGQPETNQKRVLVGQIWLSGTTRVPRQNERVPFGWSPLGGVSCTVQLHERETSRF